MVTIRQILHRVVVRPLKTTFATSLGAKTAATSVLVKVVLSDGSAARGEVPTSFAMPHETPEAIKHILVEARKALGGVPIDDYPRALAAFRGAGLEPIPSVSAARSEAEPAPALGIVPNPGSLQASTNVLREVLALAYYGVRGWR